MVVVSSLVHQEERAVHRQTARIHCISHSDDVLRSGRLPVLFFFGSAAAAPDRLYKESKWRERVVNTGRQQGRRFPPTYCAATVFSRRAKNTPWKRIRPLFSKFSNVVVVVALPCERPTLFPPDGQ